MARTLVLLSLLVAFGCGSKKPPAAPAPSNPDGVSARTAPPPADPPPPADISDADFERIMNKAVAMFVAMGEAAEASGDDCDKLADGIEQVLTDNAAFLAEAKQYRDNPMMDKRGEEWMKAHQDEVMDPMMKVAAAGQKCAGNEHFMATMEKLGQLGE